MQPGEGRTTTPWSREVKVRETRDTTPGTYTVTARVESGGTVRTGQAQLTVPAHDVVRSG